MDHEAQSLRHRLVLLANSAERLLDAGSIRRSYRKEAGAVADDILAARLLLDDIKADAADT